MNRTGTPAGPTVVPVWVTRLNEGFELVYLVLRINLVWMLLSLLGLVALGVAPASVAAADAFRASRHGAKVKALPVMWESYRRQFVTVTLRLLPLMIVQLGSVSMIWIVIGGGASGSVAPLILAGLAVVSATWSTVSAAVLVAVPRVRRQDLLVAWRLALLVPGTVPARFLALILLLGVWIVVCSFLWPLALLFGAATMIVVATALLGRRVELLLEDLEARRAATV